MRIGAVALLTASVLAVAGCGGGGSSSSGGGGSSSSGGKSGSGSNPVRLSITPAGGNNVTSTDSGITVSATGGKLGKVTVHTAGDGVTGSYNAAHTTWHSKWALNVAQQYTVTATAAGSGASKTSSFRTFTPKATFDTKIIEGSGQTYGVGMPIILYFSRPFSNTAAVERSLEVKASKRVTGSWYWDDKCGTAPLCAYFRPRHYWRPHTRVSFIGHLDGVQVAPGVYGHHTLTQDFTIGDSVTVSVSTSSHTMNLYRNKKLFAHWPISSGRPGDDTPNGTYLTIEKANPVDMVGPGYNIQVPYSVRFTWSGDYLHDAYWSVGQQGFSNVSHGCVNMSPADAATFYNMAVPGDPVTITGSPKAGTWDNGWTMWFQSWKQWVRGSALHRAVLADRHGSKFVKVHD